MKKTVIFISVMLVILAGTLSVFAFGTKNQIEDLEYTHSHTKAFCTENNFCQDYEIFCKNQDVISISPITGAAVQFSKDWEDPRDKEIRDKFC